MSSTDPHGEVNEKHSALRRLDAVTRNNVQPSSAQATRPGAGHENSSSGGSSTHPATAPNIPSTSAYNVQPVSEQDGRATEHDVHAVEHDKLVTELERRATEHDKRVTEHDRQHGIARSRGVDRLRNPDPILHVVFDQPVMPANTGNAIRMCAGAGAHLHICEPTPLDLSDRHLRRAGLDYHDLVDVTVHPSLDACLRELCDPARLPAGREVPQVFAFTTKATTNYADVSYHHGAVLLFGTEPTGLDDAALHHPLVTERVRIPMLPARRSINLSNAAAIATYEAWRQLQWAGASIAW